MHGKASVTLPLRSVLTVALLSTPILGSVAKADEERVIGEMKRPRQIVFPLAQPSQEGRWLSSHFHIKKGAGIAYTRSLSFGRHDVTVSVQGPVIRKRRYGLGVEVRF